MSQKTKKFPPAVALALKNLNKARKAVDQKFSIAQKYDERIDKLTRATMFRLNKQAAKIKDEGQTKIHNLDKALEEAIVVFLREGKAAGISASELLKM